MKLGKCDYTKLSPCIKSSFKMNRFPKTLWLIGKNYSLENNVSFLEQQKKGKTDVRLLPFEEPH